MSAHASLLADEKGEFNVLSRSRVFSFLKLIKILGEFSFKNYPIRVTVSDPFAPLQRTRYDWARSINVGPYCLLEFTTCKNYNFLSQFAFPAS